MTWAEVITPLLGLMCVMPETDHRHPLINITPLRQSGHRIDIVIITWANSTLFEFLRSRHWMREQSSQGMVLSSCDHCRAPHHDSDLLANQRPVSRSRDHPRPIRAPHHDSDLPTGILLSRVTGEYWHCSWRVQMNILMQDENKRGSDQGLEADVYSLNLCFFSRLDAWLIG